MKYLKSVALFQTDVLGKKRSNSYSFNGAICMRNTSRTDRPTRPDCVASNTVKGEIIFGYAEVLFGAGGARRTSLLQCSLVHEYVGNKSSI